MSSFDTAKRSVAAHKGHFNRALKQFYALLEVQPSPTFTVIESSYNQLHRRMDSLYSSVGDTLSLLEGGSFSSDNTVDVAKETESLSEYFDSLITEQTKIETCYGRIRSKQENSQPKLEIPAQSPTISKPVVKLTALKPPSWNGVKADFYTWKRKFVHIMQEAHISDDLTQLCYLQNAQTIPTEYQSYISDCSTLSEVWYRLEERVPRETIKYEVIAQFRKVKPLTFKTSPAGLREFVNEVSLFSRRMMDLGFNKSNYSCIIMQDIYERLDQDTSRRYRNKIELMKEVGKPAVEDLDSLCDFLRSEATTLELSAGVSQLTQDKSEVKKVHSIDGVNEDSPPKDKSKLKCVLGCDVTHRLIDCPNYTKLKIDERREFIMKSSRCFACLGANHTARICNKKESLKGKKCSDFYPHWTLCTKADLPTYTLKVDSEPFNPKETLDTEDKTKKTHAMQGTSVKSDLCGTVNSNDVLARDFSPLVLAEVKCADGSWIVAKCFLDTGSNCSLVRSEFAWKSGLEGKGFSNIQFGIAGGGTHREKGEEFEMVLRAIDGKEEYSIITTAIKKPCYEVKPIHPDLLSRYEHLEDMSNELYLNGGEVDILLGLDYAPLIIPEKITRDARYPDDSPSIAETRLGCYLYGGLNGRPRCAPNDVHSIN